jgi:hypothetical protein
LLVAGSIAMPLVCFLCAWRVRFRVLFAVPVAALFASILLVPAVSFHEDRFPRSQRHSRSRRRAPRLGLTLPGFVERSKQIAALPSLGLLYLAASTPPGHELEYHEASEDHGEPARLYDCDLVAISTFSAQVFEAYAIADRLRETGVRVAMGGLHVSARPEEALAHADYVVVGEGENAWPAVVAAAEAEAPPRIFRAETFAPVDVARPVPLTTTARANVRPSHGADDARVSLAHDFCASTVMLGRPYRKRPVEECSASARAPPRPRCLRRVRRRQHLRRQGVGQGAVRAFSSGCAGSPDGSRGRRPRLLDGIAASGCRSS